MTSCTVHDAARCEDRATLIFTAERRASTMSSLCLQTAMNGRDNNFNLLRMMAATMTLVSHSFFLVTGDSHAEPWRAAYGLTPGSVAVEIFFVISGLLLTYSLLKRQSITEFIRARGMRIYPGLIVAVTLTVFVLGPLLSQHDLQTYLASSSTWNHWIKNSLAYPHVVYTLPGVFESNVSGASVNGSLWSLRYELMCYAILLACWVVSRAARRTSAFLGLCVAVLVVSAIVRLPEMPPVKPLEASYARLFLMFFAGSTLCVFRAHVGLRTDLFLGAVALLAVGIAVPAVFPWVYVLTLPYLVTWLAYVPAGPVRRYNLLGDYSYGTYIYAFPVQQALVALVTGLGAWTLTAGAFAITLALAVASWHLVELPASRWRWQPRVKPAGLTV